MQEYTRKSGDALIRQSWKFYRWERAKKYRLENYRGCGSVNERNILKALTRNKSDESQLKLKRFKTNLNLKNKVQPFRKQKWPTYRIPDTNIFQKVKI